MQMFVLAGVGHYVFGFLLFFMAIFLIGLILLQRGRGGGLTGALGGAGGQSAFGSKTGDVFTNITIAAAAVWIVTCLAAVKVLTTPTSVFSSTAGSSQLEGDLDDKASKSDKGRGDDRPASGLPGRFSDEPFGSSSGTGQSKANDTAPASTPADSPAGDRPSAPTSEPSSDAADSAGKSEGDQP